MEKFLVYVKDDSDRPVAMRHDARPKEKEFVIGGYEKDRGIMEGIIQNHFHLDAYDQGVVKVRWHQRNKLRFTTKMDRKAFVDGVQSMRDSRITVTETRNHYGLLS